MASRAIFAARLLAGEMPPDIEEVFAAARVHLFPESEEDMVMDCSCPDWANPCKHIAAVYYVLGNEFDRDPFLVFALRGRTREEIVAELRRKRAGLAQLSEQETRSGEPRRPSESSENSEDQACATPGSAPGAGTPGRKAMRPRGTSSSSTRPEASSSRGGRSKTGRGVGRSGNAPKPEIAGLDTEGSDAADGTADQDPLSDDTIREKARPLLEENPGQFWTAGEGIRCFRVSMAPPKVPEALLKRLGPPSFWSGKGDFMSRMGELYRTVSSRALETAYTTSPVEPVLGEPPAGEPPGDGEKNAPPRPVGRRRRSLGGRRNKK